MSESGALAGFEKSGYYFFNGPVGSGYDDALVSAIAILDMLDRAPLSPSRGAEGRAAEDVVLTHHVSDFPDEGKYIVVDTEKRYFEAMAARSEP